jgi:hypothetical protein
VSRCESCAQPARCNAFMERRADEHAMPAFCPNKAAIEALAIV